MDSMLKPKLADDPYDIILVAPDAVRVAPADEEMSGPVPDAVRVPLEPQFHVGPDVSAGAAVPPVDTTFRATAVNDAPAAAGRRSLGRRALRAVAALLLAACIGGAAVAWRYHGDTAQHLIAEWAPLFAQKSSQSPEKAAPVPPPVLAAAEIDAANTSAAPPAPAAAEAASPVQPPSIETMARDLASANQEIAQLKTSVEQLKASQQQLVAMVSEKAAAQNLRPRKPAQPAAPPPRPIAALAPARALAPPLSPRPLRPAAAPIMPSATAAPLPTAAAPYVPRQVEPPSQTAGEALTDPELASVPRPPMPLR